MMTAAKSRMYRSKSQLLLLIPLLATLSLAIAGCTEDGSAGQEPGAEEQGAVAANIPAMITALTEQAKLTAGDPAAGDQLGFSVAISGNTAVVGAFGDDDGGTFSGSAYVFQRSGSTWSQQAKLTAGDAAAFDQFGISVAISGNTVVVGAFLDDNVGGNAAGSAYVFDVAPVLTGDPVVDQTGPLLTLTPDAGDITKLNGVAEDNRPSEDVNGNGILDAGEDLDGDGLIDEDSGIFSVVLGAGATNLELMVDPFTPGDGTVTFMVRLVDPKLDGSGIVTVTDGAENATSTAAEIAGIPAIDIKPGSDPNSINRDSNGVIPAAILGRASFDVTTIDVTTLTFGPGGATPAHKARGHLEDVNGDGFIDLMSHYPTQDVGLPDGAAEACVTVFTLAGVPFESCDSVRIVK